MKIIVITPILHAFQQCRSFIKDVIFSYYNAPEILLGVHKLTYAVDIWSLAITWLRILGVELCDPVLDYSSLLFSA